jgi:hypothetical protein
MITYIISGASKLFNTGDLDQLLSRDAYRILFPNELASFRIAKDYSMFGLFFNQLLHF